jgi:heat shock protein HslJ
MRMFAATLLPLAIGLSACGTMYGDPYGQSGYPPAPYPGQEPYPPQGYPPEPYPPQGYPPQGYPPQGYPPQGYPPQGYPAPVPGDYRASGTEPFWDLTIGSDMVFTDRGTGLVISQPTPSPISGTAGPIYRTQRLEVNIVHSQCNDGMSDRTYPDTVQVHADGRLYRGCGGADPLAPVPTTPPVPPMAGPPAPPLDRTRWTVVAINNRPTPRDGEYSMEFDAGRLSARFGCNGIGAGYTQSDATIDAGAIIATKMACSDMSWENQGIAILDQVMQVNALGPHRITLTSSAGTIELQRR